MACSAAFPLNLRGGPREHRAGILLFVLVPRRVAQPGKVAIGEGPAVLRTTFRQLQIGLAWIFFLTSGSMFQISGSFHTVGSGTCPDLLIVH